MKKLFLSTVIMVCLCGHINAQATPGDPNSISYTEKGVQYRLISIGDKLPRLFVNDKEIPAAQLERYSTIINKLQPELFERQKKQALLANRENEEVINKIVSDLVSQKVISSTAALTSLRLDVSSFMVNGQKQSFGLYTQYKNKFITSADKVYRFNCN
ncbi:MAG: hypothetical protein V4577_05300 [Bacteroidota bacterium]